MPKMRAMLLHEWGGRLVPAEVERPEPRTGEVLIKVEACGVGLTIVHHIRGDAGTRSEHLPRIVGHEIAGIISEVGSGVTQWQPGERVVDYALMPCGHCSYCRRARESLCRSLRPPVGVEIDGGYAEYVCLRAQDLVPLPANISFVDATTIPDACATSYHVCNSRANIRPGDRVMVLGAAGGVGIHLIQMAQLFGGDVIAVDIDDAKLAKTKEYGAAWLVNYHDPGAREAVLAATDGEGPDVIIELVGLPETLDWSLDLLGRAGKIVTLTAARDSAGTYLPRRLTLDELTITGSRYASKFELAAAVETVRSGKVRPVVSEVVPLERVEEIHDKLRRAEFFGRGALVP